MHDWMGWGWGGMWLGPLVWLALLALFVAFVVMLVRWVGEDRRPTASPPRSARDILDERYARGDIDREEYLKRRQDLSAP
jgi:putative membrane protein